MNAHNLGMVALTARMQHERNYTDEQLDRLVSRTQEEFGGVDILINNAGGFLPGPALSCTDAELDKAFHFNVTTGFRLARAFAPSRSMTHRLSPPARSLTSAGAYCSLAATPTGPPPVLPRPLPHWS